MAETKNDDKPKVVSAKVVQYVGTADIREIDAKGWDNVLPEGHGATKVVFNKANKWRISASEFSDAQLEYFDSEDDGFVVKDIDVPKA